jgi:hypothetical protein
VTPAQQQQQVSVLAMTPAEQQEAAAAVLVTPTQQQQQQQQQEALQLETSTAAGLGAALLAHGVLRERVTSFGCQVGQWVADDTIIAILAAICSEGASAFTHGGHSYQVSQGR